MLALVASVLPFAVVMSVTPGPNNFMLAASGANFGIGRTLPHIFGIAVGFPVMVILVAVGFAPVFVAVPALHGAMKVLGAAYMLYIAYRIATAAPAVAGDEPAARPMNFWEAAAFQWINPKAWVIAVGATTTYTTVGGNLLLEASIIALVFAASCIPILLMWTALGVGTAALLKGSSRGLRYFNIAMALLLVISVATLIPLDELRPAR